MHKPQLFFFHFAGGNSYSFQFLYPHLKEFDIIPLELPGRGDRMEETLIKNYEDAITDYYLQVIKKKKSNNIVLYGHSMGAILGWEVAKKLEQNNMPPVSLILSGNAGPGTFEKKGRYKLPKDGFIAELKKLGGTPKEFFEHKELYEFIEPILRADFEVLEKEGDVSNSVPLTKTPVIVMMGTEEENVSKIGNWRKYCERLLSSKIMVGDHFFIHKYPKELAAIIQMTYDKFS